MSGRASKSYLHYCKLLYWHCLKHASSVFNFVSQACFWHSQHFYSSTSMKVNDRKKVLISCDVTISLGNMGIHWYLLIKVTDLVTTISDAILGNLSEVEHVTFSVLVEVLIFRGTFCWKPHLNQISGSKILSHWRILKQ